MAVQFVAYYRLSKESRSGGLGLDAQRDAISTFLRSTGGQLVKEFTEIESGKRTDRAELLAAISLCRRIRARLVVGKLDRLARNAAFLLTLRDSGIDFVAADLPNADRLTVGIMAVVAEAERDAISRRTKDALAQAKLRGVKLGGPDPRRASEFAREVNRNKAQRFASNVLPIIGEIERAGVKTLRGIAEALNARGIQTATGRSFSPQTISNLLARRDQAEAVILSK